MKPALKKAARCVAHPWLSALLAASWLLLQHSLAPVHLLAAALIGLILPRLLHGFLPPAPRIHMLAALRLTGVVLGDIVLSNITVARLVLGPINQLQPAWVPVPLTLTHPTAIALLASIITTTPGTVSCAIDEERHFILVHALNCRDPAGLIADIQTRYEQPLMAIFSQPSNPAGESP
jgi:multicomponent K+:H+ antiporter subunit E